MRLLAVRFFLAGMLLSGVLFPVGHAQQSTMVPEAAQAAADPIIGSWKLNVEESTNSTAESELIVITRQGDQFQIVFQATQSNGYNPHYQVMTDMKGATSKLVDTDGKPMKDEWRVIRKQPNAFVVESVGPFGGWKKEYAVSADGKTLTVHELPELSGSATTIIGGKMGSNGVIHPVHQVLVFEKISDTEGRTVSQRMVDSDAAQQAIAAKTAAALAALDATACSMTHDQAGAPEATAHQSTWHEYICPKDGFGISLPNPPKEESLQRSNFYKLFLTEDESIVAQLWVSAEPVDCATWLQEMRTMMNRPLPPGAIRVTTETTFQSSPAFESVDSHTNGPKYLLYDLTQCSENRTYRFHARWLSGQPKPEEVTRIFDSFQLLTKKNNY
jgi:hypothetical protein